MSKNGEHFIREIEIKNYKLFKDFKAEGFGRVNLIGGKNNVGKTAFMEACYLGENTPEEDYFYEDFEIKKLKNAYMIIEFHRDSINLLLEHKKLIYKFLESKIIINKTIKALNEKFTLEELDIKKLIENINFISMIDIINEQLINAIDEIKLQNKEEKFNNILKELFDIDKVDTIKEQVMIKKEENYLPIGEYGDGMKHFLIILLALYLNENSILYLDEIENGIHYTNFYKLWEIILKISKEQNVQVFATTHSKECIESFNKVQKELEDGDTFYFEMYKNIKNDNISMRQLDVKQLDYELKLGEGFRGE